MHPVRSCSRSRSRRSSASVAAPSGRRCEAWRRKGSWRSTPRRGAVVISLTKRDFLEAYQVREALEALGVRLAVPRLTDQELTRLDEYIARMADHAASGDVDAFFETNAAFHAALVEASDNRMLVDVYRRLMAQMGPYRRPSARLRGDVEQSIAEHRGDRGCRRARDAERAVAMLVRHIEVPQRTIETLTEEEFARSAGLPAVGHPRPDSPAVQAARDRRARSRPMSTSRARNRPVRHRVRGPVPGRGPVRGRSPSADRPAAWLGARPMQLEVLVG